MKLLLKISVILKGHSFIIQTIMDKVLKVIISLSLAVLPNICSAQSSVTRNQILNAVRVHQQNADSVHVAVGDSVLCDSTTTKITLEVINDSVAKGNSYMLTFTKSEIEVDVYDSTTNLYRSTFEYGNSSFEEIKKLVNNQDLRKIDSYNDTVPTEGSHVLKLYRGSKLYMSVENYNGRSNVTRNFDSLVKELKKIGPDMASIIRYCEFTSETEQNDSISNDTISVTLSVNERAVAFKAKGGEFKKIKVTCSLDDWEILEHPDWLTISRNNKNEIILESTKNKSRNKRTGIVKVGCLGEEVEISVTQQ